MKLQLVPARRGVAWIREGMRTFFRQPLALSGLFFMFLAVMTIAGSIPVVGLSLALALLPACTLGLMAASREAATGRFPMPAVFLSAFRAGRQQMRAMLLLGVVYGTGFWVIMGITTLFDGGGFATGYIAGKMPTMEMARNPDTQSAMQAFLVMQLPLSLMFWHAPALVHWHAVPAAKSIFFSLIACLRNFWAFVVFGLVWMSILMGAILVVSLFAGFIGSPEVAGVALMPAAMLIAAMFFTSTYFSFRDCFEAPPEETP